MFEDLLKDAANWELADLAIALLISLSVAIAVFRLNHTDPEPQAHETETTQPKNSAPDPIETDGENQNPSGAD
ncbi:MAG: hypothetical protein AAF728_16350 [Cyanobacteria bacterium P01_D01_bin.128]